MVRYLQMTVDDNGWVSIHPHRRWQGEWQGWQDEWQERKWRHNWREEQRHDIFGEKKDENMYDGKSAEKVTDQILQKLDERMAKFETLFDDKLARAGVDIAHMVDTTIDVKLTKIDDLEDTFFDIDGEVTTRIDSAMLDMTAKIDEMSSVKVALAAVADVCYETRLQHVWDELAKLKNVTVDTFVEMHGALQEVTGDEDERMYNLYDKLMEYSTAVALPGVKLADKAERFDISGECEYATTATILDAGAASVGDHGAEDIMPENAKRTEKRREGRGRG
eukprot:TRINITY_DN19845_c0_g1_i1.p1 TRINITY_DN19845_c0_g1~~TRINITY_DN19845_c0_g1_i1.p1  ORF type:complete len:278 (+),score=69.78 TRINITY_DN19845_c0_g1_i1:97-930(+)